MSIPRIVWRVALADSGTAHQAFVDQDGAGNRQQRSMIARTPTAPTLRAAPRPGELTHEVADGLYAGPGTDTNGDETSASILSAVVGRQPTGDSPLLLRGPGFFAAHI